MIEISYDKFSNCLLTNSTILKYSIFNRKEKVPPLVGGPLRGGGGKVWTTKEKELLLNGV